MYLKTVGWEDNSIDLIRCCILQIWSESTLFAQTSFSQILQTDHLEMKKKTILTTFVLQYFLSFQSKWTNKQRVLIFSSRGISHRDRHLMLDLKKMMPHSKSGKIEWVCNPIRLFNPITGDNWINIIILKSYQQDIMKIIWARALKLGVLFGNDE